MNPLQYGIIGLAIAVIGLGAMLRICKDNADELMKEYEQSVTVMTSENNAVKAELIVVNTSVDALNDVIAQLSNEIQKHQVNIESKDKEIKRYKSLPDGEKYKEMYDRITLIQRGTDACTRYKDTAVIFNGLDINKL